MEIFKLKQPRDAKKYSQHTAVYSKNTAAYSGAYGRILRYWSLEYGVVSNTTLIIIIGKLEVSPSQLSMHCASYISSHLYMPHTPFSQNTLFCPYTPMYSCYASLCSP